MTKIEKPNMFVYYGVLLLSGCTCVGALYLCVVFVTSSYNSQQRMQSGYDTPEYYIADESNTAKDNKHSETQATQWAFEVANMALKTPYSSDQDDIPAKGSISDNFTKVAWWDFEKSIEALEDSRMLDTGFIADISVVDYTEDDFGNQLWTLQMPLFIEGNQSKKVITLQVSQEQFQGEDLDMMITSWQIN